MKKQLPKRPFTGDSPQLTPAWLRLEQVIETAEMSVNAFARYIGLPRGENLYQIKRGHNSISRILARRIHDKFPQYPMVWLLYGDADTSPLTLDDEPVVRIPLYRDPSAPTFARYGRADGQLLLSAAEAGNAQIAVAAGSALFGPALRELLVLLCEPEEGIEDGKVYFVVTSHFRLFRTVYRDPNNPGGLRLKALFPTQMDDLVIPAEEVHALWRVCGAVGKLE